MKIDSNGANAKARISKDDFCFSHAWTLADKSERKVGPQAIIPARNRLLQSDQGTTWARLAACSWVDRGKKHMFQGGVAANGGGGVC